MTQPPNPPRKPTKSYLDPGARPASPPRAQSSGAGAGEARSSGAPPIKPKPAADIDAYELDETSAPPKAPTEQINRSYLLEDPAAPGTKEPPPPPGQPRLVDPAELARKREEARKRGAEIWAEEEARKRKALLIKAAVALVVLAGVAIYVWVKWG